MDRTVQRLVTGIVAFIALSAGLAVPAQAADFEAVLERNGLILKVSQQDAFAWIRPSGSRRIWLIEGTYRWTDEIRETSGRYEMRDRFIDLGTGTYDWNCKISFVNGTYSIYRTYCQLQPVDPPGPQAVTPTFDYSVLDPYSSINWKSRLGRVPTS